MGFGFARVRIKGIRISEGLLYCSICFSWSSVSDDFSFPLVFLDPLLALSFSRLILSLSFLCSSVSEALFALSFSFLSEHFSGFFLIHAKAALAYSSRNE